MARRLIRGRERAGIYGMRLQLMRHPLGRRKPRQQGGEMSLVPVGHGTGEMIVGS